MPAPPDRETKTLERDGDEYPLPPLNLNVLWAFSAATNAVDIYWDDPNEIHQNSNWNIEGVNIYRSTDSEYGPYFKMNEHPVGATFWRDQTTNRLVERENVSNRFVASGDDTETGRWIFKVKHSPIVKPGSEDEPADHPTDVTVWIDGTEVIPAEVNGKKGEIELRTSKRFDEEQNELKDPILPDPDSTVECTYRYNLNLVRKEHYQRIFYRVTTVGRRSWDNKRRETPLKWTDPKTIHHMENNSSLWEEAIRRNQWILDQGGERVKLFIRKYMGEECDCWDETYKNASHSCRDCYGTGIKGGYEGPYDQIIAPQDAEKSIEYSERGLHIEQTYDTWTGPSPLISQRDFLVKQNNDRFAIGAVKTPTNRGNILQQHFQVEMMDENDIRYEVPVTGTSDLAFPETRTKDPEDDPDEDRYPQITEKEEVPDSVEQRGRTPVYENLNS